MMEGLGQLPVRAVSGVGPQKVRELEAFGIATVQDLLEHFPFRYEDYRLRHLADVVDGENKASFTVNRYCACGGGANPN
jgi:RecG-like helicase